MKTADTTSPHSEITPAMTLSRAFRLLGTEAMEALSRTRVIVFGVGGVGSWAAEALARTGVGHITLVDADRVAPSNINRQREATIHTVGQVKVEAMAQVLRAVSPGIDIAVRNEIYCPETADTFDLESYDYIVDAIDSLRDKALLILRATACRRPRLYSSMGAALKLNPTSIAVAEFWKVQGCPLAAALRRRFKKTDGLPRRKFQCVYSPELIPNRGAPASATPDAITEVADPAMTYGKVAYNGSLCHITGIFGFTLAGLIIDHIAKNTLSSPCAK